MANPEIGILKQAFSEYDIPKMLVSDNGPQFASTEFRTFANQYFSNHATSRPRYLQSNGMTERMLQPVKQCMMKSGAAGQDPYIVLLVYRSTPISQDLPSHTELLHGRQYWELLPNCNSIQRSDQVQEKLIDNKFRMAEQHNKHAKYHSHPIRVSLCK